VKNSAGDVIWSKCGDGSWGIKGSGGGDRSNSGVRKDTWGRDGKLEHRGKSPNWEGTEGPRKHSVVADEEWGGEQSSEFELRAVLKLKEKECEVTGQRAAIGGKARQGERNGKERKRRNAGTSLRTAGAGARPIPPKPGSFTEGEK